jgi:hypothetical protein
MVVFLVWFTFMVDPSWSTPSCTATTAMVWIPDLNCASHVRGCCTQPKQRYVSPCTPNPKATTKLHNDNLVFFFSRSGSLVSIVVAVG